MADNECRIMGRPVALQLVMRGLELVKDYPGVMPIPGQGFKKKLHTLFRPFL